MVSDAWMMQYFGHPTGQASDQSRAHDDPDGDGMTNLQEYIAGTIPTNPSSVFMAAISLVVASNNVVLSWAAVSNRTYQVQYKDSLSDPNWTDIGNQIIATSSPLSFTNTAGTATRCFRVRAQ